MEGENRHCSPRAGLGEALSSQGFLGSTPIPGISLLLPLCCCLVAMVWLFGLFLWLLGLFLWLLGLFLWLLCLFLWHFCGVCPFWWAQSHSWFLQRSPEEPGQEIQVDFIEDNGQENVSAKDSKIVDGKFHGQESVSAKEGSSKSPGRSHRLGLGAVPGAGGTASSSQRMEKASDALM